MILFMKLYSNKSLVLRRNEVKNMGYGFIGMHRKTDEKDVFYTSCMYSYQGLFRECFGREITEFSGRVTKAKIAEFEQGIRKLERHPDSHKQDMRQMRGYIDNTTFDELIIDLNKLLDLMKNKEVCYLSIC